MIRCSKRAKVEEGQNDWISQLPDSVLVEILSYLPTYDAVKMALFSRFRHIWTNIRCLSFDQRAFGNDTTYHGDIDDGPNYDERFLNLIRHVLILHERTTIDEFHLKFAFNLSNVMHDDPDYSDYASKEKRMASELTAWIKFSLRKQVKVLDIDLGGCSFPDPEENYELPNSVLTSNCLMELRLAGCGIKEKGGIQFKSLTKLSLKDIMLSDKTMGEIFEGCPMLEELSLDGCLGLDKLNLTNPKIKRLNIFIGWRNEANNSRLKISCPSLKSLELAGSIQLARLEGSPSFFDASLRLSGKFKCECRRYGNIQMLMWRLAQAKVFIPSTWTVLVFKIWELSLVPMPVTSWKSVEFRLLFTKWHLPGICSILKNSHLLETLTFYIYPGSHSIFKTKEAKWMEEYDFDGKDYWKSKKGFFCLIKYLKTVTINGYVTEPYVLELIEFLLKNALVLEKMVISTNRTLQPIHQDELFNEAVEYKEDCFTSNKVLLEFSKKLLSLPRASKSAVVEFCY